jgi:hypothetical protein
MSGWNAAEAEVCECQLLGTYLFASHRKFVDLNFSAFADLESDFTSLRVGRVPRKASFRAGRLLSFSSQLDLGRYLLGRSVEPQLQVFPPSRVRT